MPRFTTVHSSYTVKDYYHIDLDLVVDIPPNHIREFKQLVHRSLYRH